MVDLAEEEGQPSVEVTRADVSAAVEAQERVEQKPLEEAEEVQSAPVPVLVVVPHEVKRQVAT